MTAQPSSSTLAHVLETILASTAAAQRERRSGLAPTTIISDVDGDLVSSLRENLRAASQHLAMGHQSESFRDCLHPGCLDAANLIPHLDSVQEGAADGELDRIFDRVQVALDAGAYGEFEEATASRQESSSPSI